MIYENVLPAQFQALALAAAAGILCGLVYDLQRIPGRSGGRLREFFLDMLFSCFAAAVIFLLVISVTQMQLRGFVLVFFFLGWMLWYRTAGKLLRKTEQWLRLRLSGRKKCWFSYRRKVKLHSEKTTENAEGGNISKNADENKKNASIFVPRRVK